MNVFKGISACDVIGIGKAFVIPEFGKRFVPQKAISMAETENGWKRFEAAVALVSKQLTQELKEVGDNQLQKDLFTTYLVMLADTVFINEVKTAFEEELFNIEYILDKKIEEYAERLRASGNEYLTERAKDIWDVFGRVLNELLDYHPFDIKSVPDGSVIVAREMNPADTMILSKRKIAGLALTEGGISSHVSILARNYGIPLIFALNRITSEIKTGETVIVDGKKGVTISKPTPKTLEKYRVKIQEEEEHQKKLKLFRSKPGQTKDGVKFNILANIGTLEEAEIACKEGADGIGLFRTEFLFMSENHNQTQSGSDKGGSKFSEEIQFETYKKVLEIMKDKPVSIRTLDAGGDKLINSIEIPLKEEKNPLMGLRAVRLSLAYPNFLKIQLRALYRASVFGQLKIILPLITSVEQVIEIRKIIETVQQELTVEGKPFRKDVPVGIMIETAAAAIISDCLAKYSDFFSLGTNDLTQYTIGIDRENPAVAPLYNEFHLAVLRMINTTITNAAKHNIPISVCGEMASRKDSVIVLGGMGIRTLSMTPKQISNVKEILSRFTIKELESISSNSLNYL
ncbi:MAG: phosphoenolpyruvate--protein phosphotransferase [Treponema sp.]|nr:phosphoenolpyruvate--protein phosphotransferase [Treponema sp.]